MIRIFLCIFLLCITLCPSVSQAASLNIVAQPSIGLNKYDLLKQYLGTASGGDGSFAYRRVTQAMAKKATSDARDIGVSFFRISATGFGPSISGTTGDLDLWLKRPALYWGIFDQMMSDLNEKNIRVVPTFVWNTVQFPAMTGETVADLLRNPESKSYRLLEKYMGEFIDRYKNHPALFFYELTNELNLGADLDSVSRCRKQYSSEMCKAKGNYSTQDMIIFTKRLASYIRARDQVHPISSGFSVPRLAAQHLRQRPEWSPGGPDWTRDTYREFIAYLIDTHIWVDIMSIHLSSKAIDTFRFGDASESALLDAVSEAARKAGKILFIGEFSADNSPVSYGSSFYYRMLKAITEKKIALSAVWVWEFYQQSTHETQDNPHTAFSLEPGRTDSLINALKEANRKLGGRIPAKPLPDVTSPHVVLTWPLQCSQITGRQKVSAVASDEGGAVAAVEFHIDDRKISISRASPYEAVIDSNEISHGEHILRAKAIDSAGNSTEFRSRIFVHAPMQAQKCSMEQ